MSCVGLTQHSKLKPQHPEETPVLSVTRRQARSSARRTRKRRKTGACGRRVHILNIRRTALSRTLTAVRWAAAPGRASNFVQHSVAPVAVLTCRKCGTNRSLFAQARPAPAQRGCDKSQPGEAEPLVGFETRASLRCPSNDGISPRRTCRTRRKTLLTVRIEPPRPRRPPW
jgi:hypothetical protein